MPAEMETIEAMMMETEEYFSDVSEIAEKNFKHPDFKEYSRKYTGVYKRDYDRADLLYAKCLQAYEAVQSNEITKARLTKLQKAHDAFDIATSALDASNAMFTAFLDEGVAKKAAEFLEMISAMIKAQQKKVDDLYGDIDDIHKLLKKAKKDVTGAKTQAAINVAITALSLCYPPLRGARAIYVAMATTGGRLMADEFLGPSGPSTAASMKGYVTDYVGMAKEFGKVGNTLTTIYSTVDTLGSDQSEIGKAEKVVSLLRKKLVDTEKDQAGLMYMMRNAEQELMRLAISLEKAVKSASAARDSYNGHEMNRYDLLAELEGT